MKRVDIVDVKADIRDKELYTEINEFGEILLCDAKSFEKVKIGEIIGWKQVLV